MTTVIVAEKNSAARNLADALGGMSGVYDGTSYRIVNLQGHLYEFVLPHEMVRDKNRSEDFFKWELDLLPWDTRQMTWRRKMAQGVRSIVTGLRQELSNATVIVNSCDLDPTGEGDLLFWEVIDELGLHNKKFERMEFVDEAKPSLQKAFKNRRPIKSMMDEGAYRKAEARSKMDFLTMQHSRIATVVANKYGVVLRQGRLKSAMVKLVGDQYFAWKNYVEVPFFQNRFEDNNKVVYISNEEPTYATKAEVPNKYSDSPVKHLSSTMRKTAPPALFDLAGLSARLASRGMKADQVLATYQKMYEAKIVSYPRTADRTITDEQFNELLPLSNKIASAVGVDAGLLTHKAPRKSHVKNSGAHGANRPGPNVPRSLTEVETKFGKIGAAIYEILAKNYLAILAPDYEYEQQKGCVAKYPSFLGSVNVPKFLGWRAVFDDESDLETSKGLGNQAKPIVYQGKNPRPQHPTLKWLMSQLEKRNVGTGATRTSIYADTVSTKHKQPLLKETRGRITPTKFGEMSYLLLPGTKIGDLSATEQFYALMEQIEAGTAKISDGLEMVTSWVEADIAAMQANSSQMRKAMGLEQERETAEGNFGGQRVSFNRTWGQHRFTDQEVDDLLAGKDISFEAVAKSGKAFTAKGKLADQVFEGDKGPVEFFGFKLDTSGFGANKTSSADRIAGVWESPKGPRQVSFKRVFRGHSLTDAEGDALLAGKDVEIYDLVAKSGANYSVLGKLADMSFTNDKKELVQYVGVEVIEMINKPGVPDTLLGYTFTPEERTKLEAGGKVFVTGLVSKKNPDKPFNATVSYGYESGSSRKKMIFEFS